MIQFYNKLKKRVVYIRHQIKNIEKYNKINTKMSWKPKVKGPLSQHEKDQIISLYQHSTCEAILNNSDIINLNLINTKYFFKVNTKIPKTGVMLVGWGGNNGSTFTAGILANKLGTHWLTKYGEQKPNYYGSITQCSTTKIGNNKSTEIFLPLKDILPLVNPEDLVIGGWDINNTNLGECMRRAEVLEWDLQEKLRPHMEKMVPLPSIYYEDFIALNQKNRTNNLIPGQSKLQHLETIRQDIRNFKKSNKLDKVIILWTANTERFCSILSGIHDTADNLMKAISQNHKEISPSIIFAVAAVMEKCSFINGSPQNTLVDGLIQLANEKDVFLIGDDFKSGQTKMKTCLVDFLISAGIKLRSVVSYNHLGNNDGKNLSSESQLKSKEISKKSCINDIINSNPTLYTKDDHVDHEVVIKYVPSAGDSKKALDEYVSDIFLGGKHTLTLYNVCEDSLLAAPIILDLLLLTEIFERIEWRTEKMQKFKRFDTILSALGYLTKAPKTRDEAPVVNSLFRQRYGIENLFKVCAGIPLEDNMLLEFRASPNML